MSDIIDCLRMNFFWYLFCSGMKMMLNNIRLYKKSFFYLFILIIAWNENVLSLITGKPILIENEINIAKSKNI